MQGYEVYKDKYIFYSLGNCVFNMPWKPTKYSLQVNVDLETSEVSYKYLHIGKDYFPRYVDQVAEKYTMEFLNSLIDICEDNEKYFANAARYLGLYRKANRRNIVKNVWKLKFSDLSSMVLEFIYRRFNIVCFIRH